MLVLSWPLFCVHISSDFRSHLQVNTEGYSVQDAGMLHTEGGWPRDIDPTQVDQTLRFRKKVEKDESYIQSVIDLGEVSDVHSYLM